MFLSIIASGVLLGVMDPLVNFVLWNSFSDSLESCLERIKSLSSRENPKVLRSGEVNILARINDSVSSIVSVYNSIVTSWEVLKEADGACSSFTFSRSTNFIDGFVIIDTSVIDSD